MKCKVQIGQTRMRCTSGRAARCTMICVMRFSNVHGSVNAVHRTLEYCSRDSLAETSACIREHRLARLRLALIRSYNLQIKFIGFL